jgi:hypothetical protein
MFSRVYASLVGIFFTMMFTLSFASGIPPVLVKVDPDLRLNTWGKGETNLSYCNAEGVDSECLESPIPSINISHGQSSWLNVDGVVGAGSANGLEFGVNPVVPIWPLDDGCKVNLFHSSGWVPSGGELYITDTRDPIPVKFVVCASKQANGDIHLTKRQMAEFKTFYEKNKDKFLHPMRQDKR